MENRRQTARGEARLFLALTGAFSLPFWIVLFAQRDLVLGAPALFSHLLMWCPGLAALVTRWVRRRSLRGPGHPPRGGRRPMSASSRRGGSDEHGAW